MIDNTKSLKEILIQRMDREDNKLALATSIIELAKRGDKPSMGIIDKLITETVNHDDETKFPINDTRFWTILCAAVDRHRGLTF